MQWLSQNIKKMGIILVMCLGVAGIVISMVPGCESSVQPVLDAKKTVESALPILPGAEAPEGSR